MEGNVAEIETPVDLSSASASTTAPAPAPIRRGSMKDRYDELLEERKKIDAEKVHRIKETRHVENTNSIKNKWQNAVTQHKDYEIKKYEETKESTMSGFRGTHNLVKRLIKKFNKIFVQKKLKGEKFISRYAQLKEKAILTNEYLLVENGPDIIAGAMNCIDLTENFLADDIRKDLIENSILYPEIGLFGEEESRPPIEVSSLICLSESGKLVMSLRMDVLPSHANDLKSYGHQKVIFYLPSNITESTEHHVGQTILEFEFHLCPSMGWEEFQKRTEHMNAIDPVDIMKTHNSFFIKPITVKQTLPTLSPEHIEPPVTQPPLDSPCGSEPILVNAESLEPSSSSVTDSSKSHDEQHIEIVINDPRDESPEIEQEDRDGYLLLSPNLTQDLNFQNGNENQESLPIVTNYVPYILYHESHEHRLIPTSVLDPNLDLTQFTCCRCSIALVPSSPSYVCPDCKTFICPECSQSGNGVKGSIDTKQIELNAEILFKPGYSSLLPDSYILLNQIAKFLLDNPIPIRIEGHINAVQANGTLLDDSSKLLSIREPNCNGKMLSQRRAEKVSQYLQSLGIPSNLLTVEGYGGRNPITRNKNDLNKNRFVFSFPSLFFLLFLL